ncbi:LYR motif-containing protein 2-like [Watersipora subatra]|uniref:LYR motif-containing protein 2-like n=1 Tax=Watersipora subatra TaxID=2589382 RepID=UPI00355B7DFD
MRAHQAMSLKQFMLRREVITLYKEMIQTCHRIPDKSTAKEMAEWVRADFRKNSTITDEAAIRMLISHGKQSLKKLQTNIAIGR